MAGRSRKPAEPKAEEKEPSIVQGKFPLGEGEGFYARTTRTNLHYGAVEGDAPAISMVQQFLSVPATGTFDAATLAAVYEYQRKARLPITGIVDKATWEKMAKA